MKGIIFVAVGASWVMVDSVREARRNIVLGRARVGRAAD